MRVCVLYSGGKDSTYAVHWAVLHGFEVVCLLSVVPRSWSSPLFHYPLHLTDLAAKALGLPLLKERATSESEEEELRTLSRLVGKAVELYGCEALVAGTLLSDYQRLRFAMVAEEHDLKSFTPLWRKDQREYMRSLVKEGFSVIVLSVQAYGLPESIVGKVLDEELVETIIRLADTYGFNPAFEGGEAETLVVDAPLYRYRIEIRGSVKRLAPHHYVYEVVDARLVPKKSRGQATRLAHSASCSTTLPAPEALRPMRSE